VRSHATCSVYSHRVSDRPGIVLNQKVEPHAFNVSRASEEVLKARRFSVHDVYLIHGSAPNRSSRGRAAFAIRHMLAIPVFDRSAEQQQSQAVLRSA
jgi:hypothetical protein